MHPGIQGVFKRASRPETQGTQKGGLQDADSPASNRRLLPSSTQVFDVAAVRAALEQRLKSLELELHQVGRAPWARCHQGAGSHECVST